ncbi:MAG: hypothetical protein JRH01_16970 [Deltaproteobacteria bacterium]|nr:hypothetical protein [Deltaproteobacteria bacterium]MBW2396349.1 hypothetical protein [Deltaproteobacteria bacterium]
MTFQKICLAWLGLLVLGALALSPAAWSQSQASVTEPAPIEIDRDAVDFHRIVPKPTDPPLVYDTALVFTNTGSDDSRVICKAFDDDGHAVGRAATSVPALGLRYLLASDFSNGAAVLGHIQCGTHDPVIGSAFLLGGRAGITEVPVSQNPVDPRKHHATRIRFPVVFAQ